jgi:hypothetical protein
MGRICGIFLLFRNKQTKAARRQILKLAPLKLAPSDVQVVPKPVDQEELCIKLLIPGVKTNEEAEKAVNKIWNDSIRVALEAFTYEDITFTIE